MRILLLTSILVALALSGCGEGRPLAPPSGAPGGIQIAAPRDGAIFPPDFPPPTFVWHYEREAPAWHVLVSFEDGHRIERLVHDVSLAPQQIDERALGETNALYVPADAASARTWTPDASTWAEIQSRTPGSPVEVAIAVLGADEPRPWNQVSFSTSTVPVGAPIFYRDVPLMPAVAEESGVIRPLADDAIGLIEWRLRDVTRPDSKVVLTDMPSCANCHSFTRDGKTIAMDVDGPTGDKGAYAIAPLEKHTVIGPEQIITWNSYAKKPAGHKTIGFLSRVSPDGRFVLTTLNEALYVSNFADYRFLQVFFPTRGILAVYNVESGEIRALPGADDPRYVHTNGVWTPDGKHVVFSRAEAFDPYESGQPLATRPNDPNEPRIRYDLYRIPFDEGRGGTAEAIAGASENGSSNTFPKVSPDGRWIVWTRCANGQLLRPDGKLWIVPLEGGTAREMRCNTDLMNSWHTFSPNGRWLAFSSKTNTPYTQLFLTHLDGAGNDAPAVLVPNSTAANRAVNLPEFVAIDYDALDRIEVPAVAHHRLYFEALDLIRASQYAEAIPVLERALETEPTFARALVMLGLARMETGQVEGAVADFERALELDPTSSEAHNNLGLARMRLECVEDALPHLRRAIALNRLNGHAEHNLALALSRLERREEALPHFERAAALRPDERAGILGDLGFVRMQMGQPKRAVEILEQAHALELSDVRIRANLVGALLAAGLGRRAVAVLEAALARSPSDGDVALRLAWLLATSTDSEVRDGDRAVEIARARVAAAPTAAAHDVLGAAYAEVGRFDDALSATRRARAAARAGDGSLVPGLDARILAYEAGRPWRRKP